MLALLATLPNVALAQSSQKLSLQLSGLSTSIGVGSGASATGGVGVEPQVRVNRIWESESIGTISVGLGGQWTRHSAGPDVLRIFGAFLEPRLVMPRLGRTFPYVAGRLALLQQSSNFGTSSSGTAFGAGGGVAIPVSSRVNVDAGVALIRQKFGTFRFNDDNRQSSFRAFNTYAAKIGLSVGLGQ